MAKLWKSILKPDQSVVIALAVAGGVASIYGTMLPSMVEIHAAPAHNQAVETTQKKAMWSSAALVAGSYLLTRDPNVFVAGGAAFVAIEWLFRHANNTDPNSNQTVPKGGHGGYSSVAQASDDDDSYDDDVDYAQ